MIIFGEMIVGAILPSWLPETTLSNSFREARGGFLCMRFAPIEGIFF